MLSQQGQGRGPLLLPLILAGLCLPRHVVGQAECQPGGQYYFGGEARDDALAWTLTTKDYYDGPPPGFPRWYTRLQMADSDLWQRNPYIDSVFFERFDGGTWMPLYSWMADYGIRDASLPSVPLTFDGRTNPGEIGDTADIRWRARFEGAGCPTGYTSPVTMPHYGFSEGAAEHEAVANGAAPRSMPDSFHFAGAQDNSLCAPGAVYGTTAGTGPAEWMNYIRATKLPDCRWQIDLNLQGDIVNHPYMEFISMRTELANGVESIRLLAHFPGQPLKTTITAQVPCNVEHMNVRFFIFFDEVDSTSLINAGNSCAQGLPSGLENFCLRDGVQYSGAGFLGAATAECANGIGSNVAPYTGGGLPPTPSGPTPVPQPTAASTPQPTAASTPQPTATAPTSSTLTTATPTPVASGVYQDACVCDGMLTAVLKQQCYQDASCSGGGLGCFSDVNGEVCRFCGMVPFADCPGSAASGPTAVPPTDQPTPPDELGAAPTAPSTPSPQPSTVTSPPITPSGGGAPPSGVYQDACVCDGMLTAVLKQQCYQDASCSGGGLGCFGDSNGEACRFCGAAPFPDCPGSASSGPTPTPQPSTVTSTPVSTGTTPPPSTVTTTTPTPAVSGIYQDACVCDGMITAVLKQQCYQESSCSGGGVGCFTDSNGENCRFCGAVPFPDCPGSTTPTAPTPTPQPATTTTTPTATAAPITPTLPSPASSCTCFGVRPDGVAEQCFEDPSCGVEGGLGCFNADGVYCRFCGFLEYEQCPSSGGSDL